MLDKRFGIICIVVLYDGSGIVFGDSSRPADESLHDGKIFVRVDSEWFCTLFRELREVTDECTCKIMCERGRE